MQNLTFNKTQSSMSESFLSNLSLMSSKSVSMVGRISNMSISNLRIHRHLKGRLRMLKRTGEWGDKYLGSIKKKTNYKDYWCCYRAPNEVRCLQLCCLWGVLYKPLCRPLQKARGLLILQVARFVIIFEFLLKSHRSNETADTPSP